MATGIPSPELSTAAASPATPAFLSAPTAKPPRVLACVRCQQRKVKCDRNFPCANCVKLEVQCVPAATLEPRQRRRRFAERELLDRLHHYETLLRQNHIEFVPLHQHPSTREKQSRNAAGGGGGGSGDDDPPENEQSETLSQPKSFWHAMNQRHQDSSDDSSDSSRDVLPKAVVKKAWDQLHPNCDKLLFGPRSTAVDLATLHPEQVQIFRLWQIYLDNINPLLKVTHTPTLQARIIDAASNVPSIKPTLAALMFGIYCVSIMSLVEDECHTMFGASREHLLARYQFACQQALMECKYLRSGDPECLTALYFYLISVRESIDPSSLSCLLGLAIRMAQRMGLHSESACAKYPALEAEMRRRLWWSLVLFDTRICEMAPDDKTATLVPSWDCKTPLNVNDFELQPEMKDLPAVQGKSTEALFAVVWSEMGDFVRHSSSHLDFVEPTLKTVAKDVKRAPVPDGRELVTLENMMENKYLKFCNPENPLQFITIWMTRAHLAKHHLLDHYSRFFKSPTQPTDAQREAALSHASTMLEDDTKLMTSPLTRGYRWFIQFHFPLPAYLHILDDLKRRPISNVAGRNWGMVSDICDAHPMFVEQVNNPFFKIFANILLQAWDAREALLGRTQKRLVVPRIISAIKEKLAQLAQHKHSSNLERPSDVGGVSMDDFSMSMPTELGGHGMLYGIGGPSYHVSETSPSQAPLDIDMNQLDWTAIDWDQLYSRS